MIHNFNKPRHKVIPNKIPQFSLGTLVKIVSNQHPLNDKTGEVKKILPAQSTVFYMVQIADERLRSIPERMLKLVNTNLKGK